MQFLKLAAIVALALSFAQSASAATIGLPGNYLTLSSGLVGYWPLDGKTTNWATGKTTDLSGQNNAGQLINMSTTTSPVSGNDRIWAYNWDSGDRRVGVTYTPNTWVHIVWVHTGGVLYAYKNGVLGPVFS